jgi:uncharacterized RmlC-like cupin family protein
MSARPGGREKVRGNSEEPVILGAGIRVVRPGSEDGEMPQGVFGLEAVSRGTVGSEGIFMAKYRVPPGTHSDLHSHTNCETAVYVLRGGGYAYAGEDIGEYIEAGPGDFVYIPANLAHVVGCPAGGEPLEYIVSRNAPEEIVVTLQAANDLPIGPDGKIRDA